MNIVYSSDNDFVKVLGVSIISLFENSKPVNSLNVYVITESMNDDNIFLLLQIAKKYNRKIVFIKDVDIDRLSSVKLDTLTWCKAAFTRMYIGSVLQKYRLHRVLYLDCDTIICTSLMELWNESLSGKTLGMVIDPLSLYHKRNIGLSKDDSYYNSGVLLIDLDRWNKIGAEEQLSSFIRKYNGKIPYVDQGIINGALKKEIKSLPLKYNVSTIYYDYSFEEISILRKPTGKCYSKEEIEMARLNPVIIHYTKSIFDERPWFCDSKHAEKEKWLYYKKLSPWRTESLLTTKGEWGVKKIYIKIMRFLPRKAFVYINGFLHARIKPIIDGLQCNN